MSATIQPVGAWCPVDEAGELMIQHLKFYKHEIEVPAGATWRMVRVIIEPSIQWEERAEAADAIADLPDCVAAAMLGGQADPWVEDVP